MQSTTTNAHVVTIVNIEDLFARLNKEQQQAVSLKWGPSLVIAGAGSGKTTVLTRRVAYLLSALKAPAHSVLAVTFTNKAAGEMRDRLEALVGTRTAKQLTIGTFHSVCARLLRTEIENYSTPEGYKWKTNFVIYDETDSLSLVKDAISKLNLDDKMYPPKEMRSRISSFKNDGVTSYEYSKNAKAYADQKFSEIFTAYQASLARNNAFDFDDLILTFSQLLEQNLEVRQRMQERFKHVLVDEFQDTNQSQYKLVRMLAPAEPKDATAADLEQLWHQRTLMVVGDVDQSIYSWRQADFRIILGFQNDYKSCLMIKLEENYRSNATILDVANDIIKNNSERIDKVLRCNKGKGGKVRVNAGTDEIDEAYFVAEEVKRLQIRGISLSDTCVLYRTNSLSRAIEEVLVRSNIPYIMVGGTRFYERAEIKDIIGYLKFIFNPQDMQAFLRCVNVPKRGIGNTSLDHLKDFAEKQNFGALEACLLAEQCGSLTPKASKGLKEFGLLVQDWHNKSSQIPVAELVSLILVQSGYITKLKEDAASSKDELAVGRVENIEEFVNVAAAFQDTADEPTLESFLTYISLVSDLDAIKAGQDAVKLMTIHASKGLEFENVFVIGLEEGLFPHSRSRNSDKELEEERRLMYVAVTRAEERLYLTYARKRSSFAQGGGFNTNYSLPSRFLQEINPEMLMGLESMKELPPEPSYGGGGGYGGGNRGGYAGSNSFGRRQSEYEDFDPDYDDGNSSFKNKNRSGGYGGGSTGGYGQGRSGSGSYGSGSSGSYGQNRSSGSSGSGYGGNSNRSSSYGSGSSSPSQGRSSGGYGSGSSSNSYGQNRSSGYGGSSSSSKGASSSSYGSKGGGSNSYGQNRSSGSSSPYGNRSSSSSSGSPSRPSPSQPPAKPRVLGRLPGPGSAKEESTKWGSDKDHITPSAEFEKLVVGDKVMHSKFGVGSVVEVIGEGNKELYAVKFDSAGKRILDPRFAKLVKMD